MDEIAYQLKSISEILIEKNPREYFIQAFLVLLGVIVGGFITILIDSIKQKRIQAKVERSNAVSLLFDIYVLLNNLSLWIIDTIQPYEKNPLYFLEIMAMSEKETRPISIDTEHLQFLLDTDNGKQLALDILVLQEKYQNAIQFMNIRNKYFIDVQEQLQKGGIIDNASIGIEDLDKIDVNLHPILKRYTDSMINLLKSCEKHAESVKKRLYEISSSKFGAEHIIPYERME